MVAGRCAVEAARAGEAGKGFAVVAGDVKSLAKHTARAAEEMAQRITRTQSITSKTVSAIADLRQIINRNGRHTTSIASAVEPQNAATHEITRITQSRAARTGGGDRAHRRGEQAAGEAGAAAAEVLSAARELSAVGSAA